MQVNDTREDLHMNLNSWKERMLNRIEQIYEKLLGNLNRFHIRLI